MPLDSAAQQLLAALSSLSQPDPATLTVAAYRAQLASQTLPIQPDPLPSVRDLSAQGAAGAIAARAYHPGGDGPLPVVAFFHGGGFVSLGLDSHDALCRRLAKLSGALVVAFDYRLAPEHPFPAPLEDAIAALRWLHRHAAELGGDADRLAVAGDSAGGNLAAAASLRLRGEAPCPRHQLLFYPVIDAAADSASYREFADGYFLTAGLMHWFWRHYLAGATPRQPDASPLHHPDLAGTPDTTIFTAECDPLRDEGEAYAHALSAAGVRVMLKRWNGQFHGFASLLGLLPAADAALEEGAAALRNSLSPITA
jgi:acetyl esterase